MASVIRWLDLTLIWSLILFIPVLWIQGSKSSAITTFISLILAWFAAMGIKNLFYIPRPYLVQGWVPLVNQPPVDSSFPSAHSAAAFAVATTVIINHRKLGILTIGVAILVGLMRILGLVHYPQDVISGALIGSATSLIVNWLYRKFAPRFHYQPTP